MKSLLKVILFTILISLQSLFAKSVAGFKLLNTYSYAGNTTVLHFEHEKSGAQVVYLQNEDTNRAFNVAFKTRAYDDIGLPHIFEHATLAGSVKYPSSNLFFSMSSQTFNTYMNAYTYQTLTCYPLGSLSEEQLKASIDVYMNGVFYPLVLTEEFDLKREAVRFVLENTNDNITATGAVYNELQGVFANKDAVNYYNIAKDLFPDSFMSSITGGKPEDILSVKWQMVKDFHNKYYTPSNMVIYLYGKLDYESLLEYFDSEFLNKYERKTVDFTDKNYKPYKGNKDAVYEFPVSAQENTEESSIFDFTFTLPEISLNELNDLRVVINYLNRESSWFRQQINEKFPSSEADCYFKVHDLYPVFQFEVKNINEEDKAEIKEIVLQTIDMLAKTKLDKAFIKSFGDSLKMETILNSENPNGVNQTASAALCWATCGSPVRFIEEYNSILNITKTSTPATIQKTVKKYFVSPEQSLTSIIKPVAGLSEKKAAENEAFFKNMKDNMSKEEIAALIKENQDYEKWLSENEKINLIDKVKVVSTKDLPEEEQDAQISDTKENGYRVIFGNNTNSVYCYSSNIFDYKAVPQDLVYPAMLYVAVLGTMPTQNYNLDQLEKVSMDTAYSMNFKSMWNLNKDEGFNFSAVADFMCLNEKAKKCFELTEEILFETDLSDTSRLKSLASRILNSRKEYLLNSPQNIAISVGNAAANPELANISLNTTFNYWKFLKSIETMDDSQLTELVEKMYESKKYFLNKNCLTFVSITSEKQHSANLKSENHLTNLLSKENAEGSYNFEEVKKLPKSIAVIIPGNVNFNYLGTTQKELDSKHDGKQAVFSSIISDKYLFSELRYKYGSYGAWSSFTDQNIYFVTYRDPQIKNTFRVYKDLPEVVSKMEFSDSDLDGFITSIYSYLAEPTSLFNTLNSKINRMLQNDYEEHRKLRLMKEIKSFSKEDFESMLTLTKKLNKNGVKVTVGGAEQINENKEMFDLIITDFIE